MTPGEIAALPYRPCVGVVLINADGLVFAGQRADMETPAWQMPQGGVDKGETPKAAAFRELLEETGVAANHVTLLGQTADWLPYDLPPEVVPKRWGGKYRGQKQMWYLMRLDAGDEVINLTYKDVEFSQWRWMTGQDLLNVIVPFKQPIYEAVLTEFGLV
ncbi:RNA pyrophosphohydrolase [Roseobacter sp. HKCCD9010]|uniref:RNA pyrophosphohydrolase n=1 Tax=unclassified Roseobacter TaxID=196798 RepID=UPI001492B36A|nr:MULTISPECIES: RNA pyrophosphohydrolase [unclassified Roseobacter]MBF9051143.1 RNA pyrophosphohydrolase [Rhodobacterales bacterium HKCCD4356]NNV12912.1 RNA pyrophosphohydrolase [Roseobacter sp. HKCCD7357]NNV16857.1 RNA pyrophosphohydrolase [Roseobacter sp. HKCCD8768]NNV26511.1 RNA pyrophosphohydrolase [Roseobacter sp. HKCCD8192]NNV30578.1 RNA pyrophosphohydrolase [Roseobacter sp. HKCCD9061]